MSRAHLLFILLAGLPGCVPACLWRWEWSFQNPTPPAARPPLSPACLLHQSDSFLLLNSGPQPVALFRVTNETALHSCEANQLIGQSLLLPPNSSVYLNLSHSNQESAVRFVSQSIRGDCLRLSFSLTNQSRDSCDTPTQCVRTGPCFRRLSLPLSHSATCQLSPRDWIVAENRGDTTRNLSHFSNASCYSNYSIKLEPNRTALLPLSHIPQTGSLFLSDSHSCAFLSVPISDTPCSDTLCPLMPPLTPLAPLGVSLLSLLLLVAGLSFLLALCLRRKQRIASEETPAPPGELPGHYEMKNEGKLARDPPVKPRKKSVPPAPPNTSPAPPQEGPEPLRQSIVLDKRSSQFSELLSKFS